MPSDNGNRYYVEFLASPSEVPAVLKLKLQERLRTAERDLDVWVQLSSSLLAGIMQNAAVITFPRTRQPRLRHLGPVSFEELMALLVVVLQQTRLRKEMVPLRDSLTQEQLQRVANTLTHLFLGLTWREMETRTAGLSPLELGVVEQVMGMMRQEEAALEEGHLEGFHYLLGQPEFADRQRPAQAAGLLESERIPAMVAAQAPTSAAPRVIIGSGNEHEDLKSFSLVVGRYGLPGEALRTLCITGPTRLSYERAVAGVQFFSHVLGEMQEGVYGRSSLS
ncbi:MAG: hypothetical protein EXR48_06640 [Dehalococcoidia bacterium]|nr:hypothetical protein [Dehalococcoidia bacterium]